MSSDYHGPKPVTKSDKKMAKAHLKETKVLLKEKISDHDKAMKSTSNPKSKAYNRTHKTDHQADLRKVEKSLKTLSKLHPV
jgi:hypothetical protein